MGLKKLFSKKNQERTLPQKDSTRPSMSASIKKWHRKRSSSVSSHESIPHFEQDKIELPATPTPSDKDDDESLVSSTKRIEQLLRNCQQENQLLRNKLQAHQDTEDRIRDLMDDTRNLSLVSLFTVYLKDVKIRESESEEIINKLKSEKDAADLKWKETENRMNMLNGLYEALEKDKTQVENDKIQVENELEKSSQKPLLNVSEPTLTSTKSTQQEELMKMHTKAQLGLIEYLEGEDDVIQAMSRFKRQLEIQS